MSRSLEYFFLVVTFIVGISVGMYSSRIYDEKNNSSDSSFSNVKIAKSVQDAVLEKVQSGEFWSNDDSFKEKNELGSEDDKNVIEVFIGEEKISPDAKLVIKKIFTRCNHSTVSIKKVPNELINLTKQELAKKYTGWNIENFSSDEIIISKEIDANCEDHFVLKEQDGVVSVYNELTEDKMNLIENVDVDLELLAKEEREHLKDGIRVYGRSELGSLLEDYVREGGEENVN